MLGQSNDDDYWTKTEVTIEEVEAKDKVTMEQRIGYIRKKFGDKADHLIEKMKTTSILKNKDWIKLKKLYRKNDKIINYQAPPLSGPIGYWLIRDGKVIVDVYVADQ